MKKKRRPSKELFFNVFVFKCPNGHAIQSSTVLTTADTEMVTLNERKFSLHCDECKPRWEGEKLGSERIDVKSVGSRKG